MFLIEPCCTQKHLLALRHKLGSDGTCLFQGHGDLSLAELLPVLLTRYSETDLIIVAPRIPDAAAEVISRVMDRQWSTTDGRGKAPAVSRLTLVADLSKKKSPLASLWQKENPWEGRLVLRNTQQNDTAVILPDIALLGPINLAYGGHFTAMATRRARTIRELRALYGVS